MSCCNATPPPTRHILLLNRASDSARLPDLKFSRMSTGAMYSGADAVPMSLRYPQPAERVTHIVKQAISMADKTDSPVILEMHDPMHAHTLIAQRELIRDAQRRKAGGLPPMLVTSALFRTPFTDIPKDYGDLRNQKQALKAVQGLLNTGIFFKGKKEVRNRKCSSTGEMGPYNPKAIRLSRRDFVRTLGPFLNSKDTDVKVASNLVSAFLVNALGFGSPMAPAVLLTPRFEGYDTILDSTADGSRLAGIVGRELSQAGRTQRPSRAIKDGSDFSPLSHPYPVDIPPVCHDCHQVSVGKLSRDMNQYLTGSKLDLCGACLSITQVALSHPIAFNSKGGTKMEEAKEEKQETPAPAVPPVVPPPKEDDKHIRNVLDLSSKGPRVGVVFVFDRTLPAKTLESARQFALQYISAMEAAFEAGVLKMGVIAFDTMAVVRSRLTEVVPDLRRVIERVLEVPAARKVGEWDVSGAITACHSILKEYKKSVKADFADGAGPGEMQLIVTTFMGHGSRDSDSFKLACSELKKMEASVVVGNIGHAEGHLKKEDALMLAGREENLFTGKDLDQIADGITTKVIQIMKNREGLVAFKKPEPATDTKEEPEGSETSSTTPNSAWDEEEQFGSVGAVRMLPQKGASRELKDHSGQTAADQAGLGGGYVLAESPDECRELIKNQQQDRVANFGRQAAASPRAPTAAVAKTKRADMFENDAKPMGTLKIPKSSGGLSLQESLRQVAEHLGLWEKWSVFLPDLLDDASIVASQAGQDLAERIGDPEMTAAISVYTNEADLEDWRDQIYCRLTNCLRTRDKKEVRMWDPFLYYLLTGMGRLESFQGEVYRGVSMKVTNLDYYATGKTVVWTTMSSTSTNRGAAEEFLYQKLEDGGVGTFFVITTSVGKEIAKLSMIPKEDEVLLPVNSKFIVISKEERRQELPKGKGAATVYVVTMVQRDDADREVWG